MSATAAAWDVDGLLRNLTQQLAGYDRLAALSERQFDALIGGASGDLGALLRAQHDTITALQRLETERLALLGPTAAARQRDATAVTLTALEADLAAEDAARLRALRAQLLATIDRLRSTTERNRRLLQSAARLVRRWRTFLTASTQEAGTYSARGESRHHRFA